MTSNDVAPLRGKLLAALRSVAGAPEGLRLGSFPTVLPLLAEMGLVEERDVSRSKHPRGSAWFLTPEGRETVKFYGRDES